MLLRGLAVLLLSTPGFVESEPLDDDVWGSPADPEEDTADSRYVLDGTSFAGLIDYSGVAFELEVLGLGGSSADTTLSAELYAYGPIRHDLDADVANLSFDLGLFGPDDAREIYSRLTKPPLTLTQAELDTPLPSPWGGVEEPLAVEDDLEGGGSVDIDAALSLGEMTFTEGRIPRFLLTTAEYDLRFPSARDIVLIVREGGTADHGALGRWLDQQFEAPEEFTEAERSTIVREALAAFRRMRSPPALGDLQRLRTVNAVIRVFAQRDDLEPVLRSKRAVSILHAAAVLAYDINMREESALGLPVHGMVGLPSRSEFLGGPELALKSLRVAALDRVLELAFDPVDFRDAPRSDRKKSPLQSQARTLLAPLSPTEVTRILAASDEQPEVQKRILEYYVRVRHAPAIEPLLDWVLEHPDDAGELGADAARLMPDATLPAVLQRYVDPRDPRDRDVVRPLLAGMPGRLGPTILENFRLLGLDVSSFKERPQDFAKALPAFEAAEQRFAVARAAELLHQLKESQTEPATLRRSIQSIERLAQLSPQTIETNADLALSILQAAIEEYDQESPADRLRALTLLEHLPWGAAEHEARTALAITQARLAQQHDDRPTALAGLLEFDPELHDDRVRELALELTRAIADQQLNAGEYDALDKTLRSADPKIAGELDIEEYRRLAFWSRYRAAVIVGSAFGLLLFVAMIWLAARSLRRVVAWRREHSAQKERRRRRREDADANSEDAASFSSADLEAAPPDAPTAFEGDGRGSAADRQSSGEDKVAPDDTSGTRVESPEEPPTSRPEEPSHFDDLFDDEDVFDDFADLGHDGPANDGGVWEDDLERDAS